jgi:hypothetical protein
VLLLIAGVASAAAPASISRHVVAGGGQPVTDGTHFILDGTLAEPVAGPLVLQGDRQVGSGYWQELQASHDAFLPLIRR